MAPFIDVIKFRVRTDAGCFGIDALMTHTEEWEPCLNEEGKLKTFKTLKAVQKEVHELNKKTPGK